MFLAVLASTFIVGCKKDNHNEELKDLTSQIDWDFQNVKKNDILKLNFDAETKNGELVFIRRLEYQNNIGIDTIKYNWNILNPGKGSICRVCKDESRKIYPFELKVSYGLTKTYLWVDIVISKEYNHQFYGGSDIDNWDKEIEMLTKYSNSFDLY